MAGSAIVARLQLDSKDYDKKLAEAKKKTSDFAKGGGAWLTDMVGKFKTLAGAVAACKAAQEVFNATIQSSQTIGDAYTVVVSQCKGAVDEFVYAMANADFSGFNDGLKGIFKNAKEAAQAMDALGNAQISFDYLTAGYKSDFKTNMGAAKDKSKSLTERQAAYDAALGDLDKIGEAVQVYTDKTIDAVVSNAQAKGNNINKDFITRENIDRVFALDVTAGGDEEKARLDERYKEFEDLKKKEQKLEKAVERARLNGYASEAQYAQRLADIRAQINSDDMQMAALYNAMLVKGTDEWLKGLADLVVKADNANSQYQELKTSSLEVKNQLASAGKEADKLAASAAKASAAVKKTLTGEEYSQLFGMQYFETLGNKGSIGSRVAAAQRGEMATIHEDVPIIDTTFEEEEPLPALTTTTEELKAVEEQTYSSIDAINALGGSMKALSGLVGEDAAAWVDWGTNLVSAIAAAIPQIAALTAAKSTEATANTAAAASGAGSAVASIPVVGPIMAVAAIASVVAALANLPKFATGGVVPGNMMSGDNVLIRANSGEVVLNKQQQDILSNRLNGGMNGKVVFKIEGSTLVGVLNNNQKIASRNYGA